MPKDFTFVSTLEAYRSFKFYQILLSWVSDGQSIDKLISTQLSDKVASWKPAGMLGEGVILFFPVSQSAITEKTSHIVILS